MVDKARFEREGSHGTSESDEVPKERKQSSKECTDSDVGASGDEADKHAVHRPLTPILPGKMCVHELIHGCCIDLCTQINLFVTHSPFSLRNFTPVEELCKAVTKICPWVYICVQSCRYYNKVYTQEAVQFNGHQWSLQDCDLHGETQ